MNKKNNNKKSLTIMKALGIFVLLLSVLMPTALAIDIELLATNPSPVVAGDYADITIRFSRGNQEAPPSSAEFYIEETPFILPVSEKNFELKGLRSGDVVTHTVRVFFSDRLPEGYINIPAVVKTNGGEFQEDLRVFIQEEETKPELYVGAVETTPNELLPDTDNNKIIVTLQNLGDKEAELVRAELRIQDPNVKPSYAYSYVDSVAEIASGDEAELEFTLDLEENVQGEIPAELIVRYRAQRSTGETYDVYEEAIPFAIPITDAPLLKVVGYEQLSSFKAGSTENKVRLTIMNDGQEKAEEVRVRAMPDISYPLILELTTEYVASEIKPGENVTVEFTMEVISDAQAKDYPISVRLESLVDDNRYSREDSFSVTVTQENNASTNTWGYLLIAIAVIGAILLGVLSRRSSKKKK